MSNLPTASQTSVISQFQLIQPDAQAETPTDALIYVSGKLTESVYRPAAYAHVMTCSVTSFADKDLRKAASVATPKAAFRMGSQGSTAYWYPWQEHLILAHSSEPIGRDGRGGHRIAMSTGDLLMAVRRSSKTAAHRGRISEIVAKLADANGFKDTVIEETDGEGVYIQSFTSDEEFIRERLLPRAVNRKGVGGYYFFLRDGVLHFHTADYQARVQTFVYYATPEIIATTTDRTQTLFDDGVAGVRHIASDPYTGQTKEVPSSPNAALKLSDVLYPAYTVSDGQLNVPYHLGQNPPSETYAMAQFGYSRARSSSFEVFVAYTGLLDIRIGDMVNLVLHQQAASASPMSGIYYCTDVVYTVADKTVKMGLTLIRGETPRITSDTTVNDGNGQLTGSIDAPGIPLALGDVAASMRTRGATNTTSRTVLVPIRDAGNG